MSLPIVEKPGFNIARLDKEGVEFKHFDPLRTVALLSNYQVDEHVAYFLGWKYEQRESVIWWHRWARPDGKGTWYGLGSDLDPPRYRASKWGNVIALCMELGWEPNLSPKEDEGKIKYGFQLAGLEKWLLCETRGDAICRSFLQKAWTEQEARGEEAPHAS